MIVGFDIYAWKAPSGVGMSFQPRAAQVVELVEYVGAKSAEDVFDVVPGGFQASDDIPF
jgi:urease beta subunit